MNRRTTDEEAARWFSQLHEHATEESYIQTFMKFSHWMSEDSSHRTAYEQVEQTMLRLNIPVVPTLPSLEEMAGDDYDGSLSIEEWQSLQRSNRRRSPARLALAAGIAAATLLGAMWFQLNYRSLNSTFAFHTGAGERREIRLPEGSRITLDANSVLSVELTPEKRSLWLTQGEAFFQVSKNRHRPFIVQAGSAQVRAIGTAFNVRMGIGRTVVSVTEGVVEVTPTGSLAPRLPSLGMTKKPSAEHPTNELQVRDISAGEAVSYMQGGSVEDLPVADASLATTWLNGRREYHNEPLRFVLADFERYTGKRIKIADESTGDLKFIGTLNLDDSDAWLKGLAVALPVVIKRDKDGQLSIEGR